MEDWDIPEQDDFESRYADELEMLDDLEKEGENQLSLGLGIPCYQRSLTARRRDSSSPTSHRQRPPLAGNLEKTCSQNVGVFCLPAMLPNTTYLKGKREFCRTYTRLFSLCCQIVRIIGHFRVAVNLTLKARLSAKLFI